MTMDGIQAQRSGAAWVRDLTSRGQAQAVAIDDLSKLLRRAALYTLRRTAGPATTLARAQVEQIAEACVREAVLVVLDRLPEYRPESKFTTWAYKFAVKCSQNAAGLVRGEIT